MSAITFKKMGLVVFAVFMAGCNQQYEINKISADTAEVSIIPRPAPSTSAEFEATCASPGVKHKRVVFFVDNPGQCSWDLDGNLGKLDRFIQARKEQQFVLPIGVSETVCQLKIESPTQSFWYDDQIILTYNNFVLAATYRPILSNLLQNDGIYSYDWNRLKGRATDPAGHSVFCSGESSVCEFPPSDQTGQIRLDLQSAQFYHLSVARDPSQAHAIQLITTGDNDTSDCQHTPFEIALDIAYF